MTSPPGTGRRVFPDAGTLMREAADLMVATLAGTRSRKRIVLAGGSTPRGLYAALAGRRPDWSGHRFTFGDERCVPPDHPESNYGTARAVLLDPLGIGGAQVLRLEGERDPEHAAAKADRALYSWTGRMPVFDLVLLGLGTDGHVASLFPAESWPEFGSRRVAVTDHPEGGRRLTLTPSALRSTGLTLFLVSGSKKADAVKAALQGGEPGPDRPATMVAGAGNRVLWLLDREAASGLAGEPPAGPPVSGS